MALSEGDLLVAGVAESLVLQSAFPGRLGGGSKSHFGVARVF
jgi:hypothetical protein